MHATKEINELFPDEQLFVLNFVLTPWFANFANFLVCGIMPYNLLYQQKGKFLADIKLYFLG